MIAHRGSLIVFGGTYGNEIVLTDLYFARLGILSFQEKLIWKMIFVGIESNWMTVLKNTACTGQ